MRVDGGSMLGEGEGGGMIGITGTGGGLGGISTNFHLIDPVHVLALLTTGYM